jgi:predicted small secreted protein
MMPLRYVNRLDEGPVFSGETMMTRTIRAAFATALLLGSVTLLSACNTVEGAGQDVSSAGHAVTNAADSAKH